MTHDELLGQIAKTLQSYIQRRRDSKRNARLREYVIGSLQALLAVAELHKPYQVNDVYLCNVEPLAYPCPTIQAIEKELI